MMIGDHLRKSPSKASLKTSKSPWLMTAMNACQYLVSGARAPASSDCTYHSVRSSADRPSIYAGPERSSKSPHEPIHED